MPALHTAFSCQRIACLTSTDSEHAAQACTGVSWHGPRCSPTPAPTSPRACCPSLTPCAAPAAALQDCMGRTAVHFAASLDHPECILALAEHDTANPEAAAAAEGTRCAGPAATGCRAATLSWQLADITQHLQPFEASVLLCAILMLPPVPTDKAHTAPLLSPRHAASRMLPCTSHGNSPFALHCC